MLVLLRRQAIVSDHLVRILPIPEQFICPRALERFLSLTLIHDSKMRLIYIALQSEIWVIIIIEVIIINMEVIIVIEVIIMIEVIVVRSVNRSVK